MASCSCAQCNIAVMLQGTQLLGYCPTPAFHVCLLGAWEYHEPCEQSCWLLQQAEDGGPV